MRNSKNTALLAILLIPLCLLLVSCQSTGPDTPPLADATAATNTGETAPTTETSTPVADPGTSQPASSGQAIDPSQPVRLSILSPKPEEIVPKNRIDVFIKLENYEVSPNGNGICIILDNQSPRFHYKKNAPIVFSGLPDGGHTLRAYPVTPNKTALKNPESHAEVHFYVRKKDFQNYLPPKAPSLSVTSPQNGAHFSGEEATRVLFDFNVKNTTLGEQYRIRYSLNGQVSFLTDLQPVTFNHLHSGTHILIVELVDKNNRLAPGIYNRVERKFTVEKPASTPSPAPTGTADPASTNSTPEIVDP